MSQEKRKSNPKRPQPAEIPLKARLDLNQSSPRCIAEGCGKLIQPLLDGVFVVHRHEVAAFCSAGCLSRTVLAAAEQQYIREQTGGRDLLAELGYELSLAGPDPALPGRRCGA